MPKATKKLKHLEIEEEKERGEEEKGEEKDHVGDDKQQKAGKPKKRRMRRFLAPLLRAWTFFTCRIPKKEKSEEEGTSSRVAPRPRHSGLGKEKGRTCWRAWNGWRYSGPASFSYTL